ncbi:TrkH family potassium uptake protein [Peptostreptococcus anaerobius]|uniref:Potassium uptake protein, TrkH family n=1 Tax=Peptostreptococcus anaerobius 653-L TaxID=596329 RepID=D3MPW2_9FIRM|nr:Trk family potassium uptake protein [Peptostreptococcus anaerobius]EFD05850.1 potassium uptake protein, TrkH family [Peptostreptococcus anaerobius 653-L]
MLKKFRNKPTILYWLSPAQIMVFGFGSIILLGAFLLTLPIASNKGVWTPFIDCLFTATSSVCVTGLVVLDTSLHWSLFGKIVIILLIQIGGLGFMTISTLIVLFLGKKVDIRQRVLIKESYNQDHISGTIKMVLAVIKYTFSVEIIGSIILSTVFIPEFGFYKGIGYSVFHSISAFCNAGFDLFGSKYGAFTSISHYYNNPVVVFTIAALIILGGAGFFVGANILSGKSLKKWKLTSKLGVLIMVFLLVLGTVLLFTGEYNHSLSGMTGLEKFEVAFFQSVTARTAGFATIDLTKFRESSLLVMIFLMFIGASPASTGGGIKTTTFAVLLLALRTFLKNESEITVFRRRIGVYTIRKSIGVLVMGMIFLLVGTYLISATQGPKFGLLESSFEVTSAYATVGLSLAGTNNLNGLGRFILIVLMFAGRVGSLTLVSIFIKENKMKNVRYAEESITVG